MDLQIDAEYLKNFIPATISLIITGIGSVIIGVYLEKFKNKITFLKYKVFFQPLATTSQNDYWGNIQVTHNGRTVNHLSFATIEIKNDSNRDIENINIDISLDQQSQFLGVSGFHNETKTSLLLEQHYFEYYNNVLERNEADMTAIANDPNHVISQQLLNEIQYVQGNKKFNLPILNRDSSITIHLLIENFQGLKPVLNVNILHRSTKLILEVDKEAERKSIRLYKIIIGIIYFLIGLSILLKDYPTSWVPLSLCGILGLSYYFIGGWILLLLRAIKKYLS